MDENEIKEYKYMGIGLGQYEKRTGHQKFIDYIEKYNIASLSDLSLLEELVYLEILGDKIKINIAEKQEQMVADKKPFTVPKFLIEAMKENFESIISIKEKLGMFENKDGNDGFQYITKIKDKFKKWEEDNQASRTFVCPHCSKMMILRVKPDVWEAAKHPFFRDKFLANKHLIRLYKAGKLTATDVSDILETSPKYTQWLVEKWDDIPADDDIPQEK